MTWTLHQSQQQRGAQLHARSGKARAPGEAPAEAVADRAAQEHDLPGSTAAPKGRYPASRIEDRDGDNTPTAGDPRVEWDDVVQPTRQPDEPEPDATELDEDQRGEDVERVPDAQTEQLRGEDATDQDAAALDDAARADRND